MDILQSSTQSSLIDPSPFLPYYAPPLLLIVMCSNLNMSPRLLACLLLLTPGLISAQEPTEAPELSAFSRFLHSHWLLLGILLLTVATVCGVMVHYWLNKKQQELPTESQVAYYITPRRSRVPQNCWFDPPKQLAEETTPLSAKPEGVSGKLSTWLQRSIVRETFLSRLVRSGNA